MNLRSVYMFVNIAGSTESSVEFSSIQRDSFCASVTHISDSTCLNYSPTQSVCALPRIRYKSVDQFIDCSNTILLGVAERYSEIRESVHEHCNMTEYLPEDYFDLLDDITDFFERPEETDDCSALGLLSILDLVLDIPSFVAKGVTNNAGIWRHRAYPKVSPLSFPDISDFVESVSTLPASRIPRLYSHMGILQTLYKYRPHAGLTDDVFSIIDGYMDTSLERFLTRMFASTLKRSLRVSTRPIRPTDKEALEVMGMMKTFMKYMRNLQAMNGIDVFNSIVPRDLLLFMVHHYTAGISPFKEGSIVATSRRFEVKNAKRAPITIANTPPGFFTTLIERHVGPYLTLTGGSFDDITPSEFEDLVSQFLKFSWSAMDPVSPLSQEEALNNGSMFEDDSRPDSEDVLVHALLVMVYKMGIVVGVPGVDSIPFDRILNGTISTNVYRATLERLTIDEHNYLDMAAALVCRLDIGAGPALTFFKLLKKMKIEEIEATTASKLHVQFSHRFIPIENGFLEEEPLALHLPFPDEWGVNRLYALFRATVGSRMNKYIFETSDDYDLGKDDGRGDDDDNSGEESGTSTNP